MTILTVPRQQPSPANIGKQVTGMRRPPKEPSAARLFTEQGMCSVVPWGWCCMVRNTRQNLKSSQNSGARCGRRWGTRNDASIGWEHGTRQSCLDCWTFFWQTWAATAAWDLREIELKHHIPNCIQGTVTHLKCLRTDRLGRTDSPSNATLAASTGYHMQEPCRK